MNKMEIESEKPKSLLDMLPILTFVGSYFIFHYFDWMEATHFIFATIVSLLTYVFMVYDIKLEHKKMNLSKLYFYTGILSALTIIIFLHGFLHWRRMVSMDVRMTTLFALVLVYVVALFRAIRVLAEVKAKVEKK